MHLNRAEVSTRIPIPRKGTKYIARAASHSRQGIPVVVAVRDMLNLAKTTSELKFMVANKLLKLNGREVRDYKEGIRLMNILEADKKYKLIVMQTGRFAFEETKDETRIGKIIGKKILSKNRVQLNLHDGTNIISKEKAKIGDSVRIDFSNKIKDVLPLEKGKNVFVISGRSAGNKGKIKEVHGRKARIEMEEREAVLNSSDIIVI